MGGERSRRGGGGGEGRGGRVGEMECEVLEDIGQDGGRAWCGWVGVQQSIQVTVKEKKRKNENSR